MPWAVADLNTVGTGLGTSPGSKLGPNYISLEPEKAGPNFHTSLTRPDTQKVFYVVGVVSSEPESLIGPGPKLTQAQKPKLDET